MKNSCAAMIACLFLNPTKISPVLGGPASTTVCSKPTPYQCHLRVQLGSYQHPVTATKDQPRNTYWSGKSSTLTGPLQLIALTPSPTPKAHSIYRRSSTARNIFQQPHPTISSSANPTKHHILTSHSHRSSTSNSHHLSLLTTTPASSSLTASYTPEIGLSLHHCNLLYQHAPRIYSKQFLR